MVLGLLFELTRPSVPNDYSSLDAVLGAGKAGLTDPVGTLWAVFFGVGVIAVLVLLPLQRWLRSRASPELLEALLLVAFGCLLVESVSTGSDVSRLAFGALPFAIPLAVAAAAKRDGAGGLPGLALLTLLTILLWQPFRTLPAGDQAYVSFYYPRTGATLAGLGALIASVAVLVVLLRADRSRAVASAGESGGSPSGVSVIRERRP